MKKFILLFTILMLTTMNSCEKDEKGIDMIDNIKEGIVGTWKRQRTDEGNFRETAEDIGYYAVVKTTSIKTLNSDFTYNFSDKWSAKNTSNGEVKNGATESCGKYVIDIETKSITLYPDDTEYEYAYQIITLTDKKLIFDSQEPYYRVK